MLYPKIFPHVSQDISHKDFQKLKFAQVQLDSQSSGRKMEHLNLQKEEEETVERENHIKKVRRIQNMVQAVRTL